MNTPERQRRMSIDVLLAFSFDCQWNVLFSVISDHLLSMFWYLSFIHRSSVYIYQTLCIFIDVFLFSKGQSYLYRCRCLCSYPCRFSNTVETIYPRDCENYVEKSIRRISFLSNFTKHDIKRTSIHDHSFESDRITLIGTRANAQKKERKTSRWMARLMETSESEGRKKK